MNFNNEYLIPLIRGYENQRVLKDSRHFNNKRIIARNEIAKCTDINVEVVYGIP